MFVVDLFVGLAGVVCLGGFRGCGGSIRFRVGRKFSLLQLVLAALGLDVHDAVDLIGPTPASHR